jgi:mRNA interferase MazF
MGDVRQGDIYWIDLGIPFGSEPGYVRPYVVIQNNAMNSTRIRTVIVCVMTTNLKRAAAPGNILLKAGEAGLPRDSVVNVSQLLTVDKARLTARIGTLSASRIRQILDGIRLLIGPREPA